jgi:hypothetical protein
MDNNIADELKPLIVGWISEHPKYGPLDEALKHRGLVHPIMVIDNKGVVIAYDGICRPGPMPPCDSQALRISSGNVQCNYVDPAFFDRISDVIETHIAECTICQELI